MILIGLLVFIIKCALHLIICHCNVIMPTLPGWLSLLHLVFPVYATAGANLSTDLLACRPNPQIQTNQSLPDSNKTPSEFKTS